MPNKSTKKLLIYLRKKHDYFCVKGGQSYFFCQVTRMAEDLNISRRTVLRHLKTIENAGVIHVQRTPENVRKGKNYYQLQMDKYRSFYHKHFDTTKSTSSSSLNLGRKDFSSKNLTANFSPSGSSKNLRQRLKRKRRDWAPYILDYWNSKGPPLRKHKKAATKLYSRFEEELKKALLITDRHGVCRRIDYYFWLLTETDLKKQVDHNSPGLVVNIDEFFNFRDRTIILKRSRFSDIKSWFDECGGLRSELLKKYMKGSPSIAERLKKEILRELGYKITPKKAMQVSNVFMKIINRHEINRRAKVNLNLVHEFVRAMQSEGITHPKYIGSRVYDAFEDRLKQKKIIVRPGRIKPTRRLMRGV